MGTTEAGAVDKLDEIIEVRKAMQKQGFSFLIHADAAWGGYFASMLQNSDNFTESGLIPLIGLHGDTIRHLKAMKNADSVTIDPHKAGYIPYPAGSLCYRDGRLRYLVTWSAQYVDQGANTQDSIGKYGVEGR